MDDFIKEVKNMSTEELIIVINDQEDLYTKEEFEILKKELESRNMDSSSPKEEIIGTLLENEIEENEKERIKEEIEERKKAEEKIILEKKKKIEILRNKGINEIYEYKVIKIQDSYGGSIDTEELTDILNNYALEGWRVKTSYSNELGKNSSTFGVNGISSQTNSTVDEHIIIMERIIKV